MPHGFLSVACQPALPVNADHWVWPQPRHRSPRRPGRTSSTLVLSKPGSSPRTPLSSTVRWATSFSKVPPSCGFQVQVVQLGGIHAGRLESRPVVEDGDGVPVLRRAVALAVLALPQFGQARLVVGVLDVAGRAEVVERAEDLQIDVLGELRQVVGEDVRRGAGDEAGGELGPVVVPAVLRDVDLQVRGWPARTRRRTPGSRAAGRSPTASTRWCRSRLLPVPPPPQAVKATAVSMATAAARIRCRKVIMPGPSLDPAEADGVDDALREQHEQQQHRQRGDEVAAIRPAQSGPVCGVCDLKTPSATVSTRDLSV